MKIAVIGAGAMGSIYGGRLSLHNDVCLVDNNQSLVDVINRDGLNIEENGTVNHYCLTAVKDTSELEPVDLVILFVKALYSESALRANRGMIGDHTYVMTLQNGSGHEDIISEFVSQEHIIIGTTEDNGAILAPGRVRRGGSGRTNIGMLSEDKENQLSKIKENFDACGFDTLIHENILKLIWEKLLTNVSLSAVTGILQTEMGFISANPHAWILTERLVREAVGVASGLGLDFDEAEILDKIRTNSQNSPNGVTSICADLRNGRKTEVDTISGSVVRAAKRCQIPAPSHEFLVELVHAMEDKAY